MKYNRKVGDWVHIGRPRKPGSTTVRAAKARYQLAYKRFKSGHYHWRNLHDVSMFVRFQKKRLEKNPNHYLLSESYLLAKSREEEMRTAYAVKRSEMFLMKNSTKAPKAKKAEVEDKVSEVADTVKVALDTFRKGGEVPGYTLVAKSKAKQNATVKVLVEDYDDEYSFCKIKDEFLPKGK